MVNTKVPANQRYVSNVESNISDCIETYQYMQDLLGDYDTRLISVLNQHERDFLHAYKLHMLKIEKELIALKSKSKDQDSRLTQDTRIVALEQSLVWFKKEFDGLIAVREKNEQSLSVIKSEVEDLTKDTKRMSDEVKAARRQNKMLAVALQKVE